MRAQTMSPRDVQAHGAQVLPPGAARVLLSPEDVVGRLQVSVANPERWVRRVCRQWAIPFVRIRGRTRLTEAQFAILVDRMTCLPCAVEVNHRRSTFVVRSGSKENGSSSQNTVRERVRKRRHPT